MKVLHVAHSIARSYGGPTESLRGFASAAKLSGADISIAAPRCSPADEAGLETVADEIHRFDTVGRNAFSVSASMLKWLDRNVGRYDVVHVHGLFNPLSSIGARISIRRGVPTIVRPFGTLSRYTFAHRRTWLKKLWYHALERKNLVSASLIHFTTESERDEAGRLGLDLNDRAVVVPPPFFSSTASRPIREREPVVLFLSRLHPVKNVEKLIDAWSLVSSQHTSWRLVIAGSGERRYEATLRDRAASSAGHASISFAGFLSGAAKAEMMGRASLFVLPSDHENFGISVLESLSSGLPAVVTPQVQLAPFIRENRLGVVATAEPAHFARAIATVIDDVDLQARMREVGPSIVARYFGSDAVGRRLMDMYSLAIQGRSVDLPPTISNTT